MNVILAANKTLDVMKADEWQWDHVSTSSLVKPVGQDTRINVSEESDSFEHVTWMLQGIVKEYITGEKAHRWLGWAQAVISIHQEGMPLETFKEINK